MIYGIPAIPYPPARPDEGYWRPVTSTIVWCEEDYYATLYSAEIVNSLTNLLFIALGIKGIRGCLKHGHDSVFVVAFIGYLLVGTGSLLFHSTLKYPMQLVDELSMIYTASLMCYSTFSFSQSRLFRQILAVGLASLDVFITLYYHYLQDPVFHQVAFALLSFGALFRSIYAMEVEVRPSLRKKYATNAQRQVASKKGQKSVHTANAGRDDEILREMWLLVVLGLVTFLGGFVIWTIDNNYCSTLRRWRREVGLPWGILLEGHGWWHLMTGVGTFYHLNWAVWLRHCRNGKDGEYRINWPSLFLSLPDVVPVAETESSPSNNRITKPKNGQAQSNAKVWEKKST